LRLILRLLSGARNGLPAGEIMPEANGTAPNVSETASVREFP